MDVILTHGYFLEEDQVEQKVLKPYPPLGLLCVSAYLDKYKIEHDVFDSTFQSFEKLTNFIVETKPAYLGIYANFLTRKNILKIIRFIKNNHSLRYIKIILGGPDVKYHAEDYLNNGADFLIIGEGEFTMFLLINSLKKGESLEKIDGIVYKNESQKIIFTKPRSHFKNLDELPWPNRNKIDIGKYLNTWKEKHGYNSITINTQRGCPYTCKWCSHAVFGDTYRRRSPESVVEELAFLQEKYLPDSFWFVDDVFTMSEKWIDEFTSLLQKKNLKISYECISRADKLNKNIVENLKASGCNLLWIGAESGSQKVIDLMDRRVDVLKVREMIKLASTSGIKTGTFIMLGYPGETIEDIEETIRHLKECNPDYFTINMAYPIKGTKLFNEVESIITNADYLFQTPDREIDFTRTYKKSFTILLFVKCIMKFIPKNIKLKKNGNYMSNAR
ncbi:MAG: radical SAM protein [Bacteroidales bacterium]